MFYGLLLLAAAAMLWLYYWFNPATEFFPRCPFLSVTGLQCPGCGSQRAIHEMLHGNLSSAFRYNPLLFVSLPYVVAGLLFNLEPIRQKYPKLRNLLFGKTAIYIVLVVIVAFSVLRNL